MNRMPQMKPCLLPILTGPANLMRALLGAKFFWELRKGLAKKARVSMCQASVQGTTSG